MKEEPIILSVENRLFPASRNYWTTPDMLDRDGRPYFTAQEVAKGFLGRSPIWLRMRLWRGYGAVELDRTDSGHRRWRLYDIEHMARQFLEENALQLADYARTVNVIKAVAHLYQFDLGDYDPMATTIPFELDPIRMKTLQAVLYRLEAEDAGYTDPEAQEAADEHLVARAAWAWRGLEDYYRGAAGD
jgi:hypothetical protein